MLPPPGISTSSPSNEDCEENSAAAGEGVESVADNRDCEEGRVESGPVGQSPIPLLLPLDRFDCAVKEENGVNDGNAKELNRPLLSVELVLAVPFMLLLALLPLTFAGNGRRVCPPIVGTLAVSWTIAGPFPALVLSSNDDDGLNGGASRDKPEVVGNELRLEKDGFNVDDIDVDAEANAPFCKKLPAPNEPSPDKPALLPTRLALLKKEEVGERTAGGRKAPSSNA